MEGVKRLELKVKDPLDHARVLKDWMQWNGGICRYNQWKHSKKSKKTVLAIHARDVLKRNIRFDYRQLQALIPSVCKVTEDGVRITIEYEAADEPKVSRIMRGKLDYYKYFMLHSFDGLPAIENTLGKAWFYMGKLHNTDGPAYIDEKCTIYAIMGEYHREGGPAVICDDYVYWYMWGVLHREDGPAYLSPKVRLWFNEGNYPDGQFMKALDCSGYAKHGLDIEKYVKYDYTD